MIQITTSSAPTNIFLKRTILSLTLEYRGHLFIPWVAATFAVRLNVQLKKGFVFIVLELNYFIFNIGI